VQVIYFATTLSLNLREVKESASGEVIKNGRLDKCFSRGDSVFAVLLEVIAAFDNEPLMFS
jgi:hypothetical protein